MDTLFQELDSKKALSQDEFDRLVERTTVTQADYDRVVGKMQEEQEFQEQAQLEQLAKEGKKAKHTVVTTFIRDCEDFSGKDFFTTAYKNGVVVVSNPVIGIKQDCLRRANKGETVVIALPLYAYNHFSQEWMDDQKYWDDFKTRPYTFIYASKERIKKGEANWFFDGKLVGKYPHVVVSSAWPILAKFVTSPKETHDKLMSGSTMQTGLRLAQTRRL